MESKPLKHESGQRTGWLFNYHNTSENIEAEDGKESTSASAVLLLFLDHDGDVFEVIYKYQPYFLVGCVEGHEREVELGITSTFGGKQAAYVQQVDKEDLDLVNHLSGKKKTYLKIVFTNTQDLTAVRGRLETAVKRNQSMQADNPFHMSLGFSASGGQLFGGAAELTDGGAGGGSGLLGEPGQQRQADALAWMSWVSDIREYDVKYSVRVAIDCGIYVGLWYDITVTHGHTTLERCDDSKYAPAMPKVCAFDIETTKAPLKFPQPEVDQIYMISYMVDGRGFLIVNREIVSQDIGSFEYTPKPEYEGYFDSFNEPDEYHTLRRFFDEMKRHKPNVYVTYNGDYFDFPFIHARAMVHGMNMRKEIGFAQGAEGAMLNMKVPHLDCFYWVKRDSYLPQGSQGLKAVTKYKLGYDPIEVDPEEMLPLAQNDPQRMASYSVSDAVSTYYLYMKYVHPFIFSLCTIIPMQGDEVLRRGSGTLCESLLMVQAYAKNVVFPNKQQAVREKFFNGHLIDSETYIGGRVEALKSGVYRSNIDMHFRMNPATYQMLLDKLDDMLRFAVEVEGGVKLEDVTNYAAVRADIQQQLEALRDRPERHETPLIYHLDVGAMYPNIILTNRLQPSSMVTPDICAGCCFNSPGNELKCKRDMTWVWKGEIFTANRHEFTRIKAQLESESFAASVVQKADIAAVQKKTYGNRKGSVLEGTSFEQKDDWKNKKGGGGGGYNKNSGRGGAGGYRQMSERMRQEANDALLPNQRNNTKTKGSDDDDGDDSEDENGAKQFHKLEENTQFSMLKKRLAEYCRRAYGKVHEAKEIRKTNTVCQRENSFYVDTVRLFRDRRYLYKAELKKWKGNLDKATDPQDIKIAKSRCVQMESLQLAHKCILNSFYGYVMRKGSRWYSMEMAGIVTYLGATLIQVARALVQQIGETLELDTDGIWCCLPRSFPENFTFTTKNGKKVSISYPCVMLNKDVHDIYSNHQYQELLSVGNYSIRSECSIAFEVDGPYLAMILPASREEGKSIKKRYAVFHPDGRLAELKGFELKRRGELMLIKDFQSLVFKRFLDGKTLKDAFEAAAVVANSALDLLYNEGEGYDPDEVIEKLTESSNMTRRLSEYPESQKSLALTTARRIAEFLGPQMVKDKGLACHFVISKLPLGKPVTERTIPLTIFKADPAVRIHFLRKWTGDSTLPNDCQLKDLLDWEYYIARFNGCVQKIITIPAALQGLPNPVARVPHPEWLHKKIQQQQSRFRQQSLTSMFGQKKLKSAADAEDYAAGDIEDLISSAPAASKASSSVNQARLKKLQSVVDLASDDSDVEVNEEQHGMAAVESDVEDDPIAEQEAASAEALRAAEEQEAVRALKLQYFTPGNTRPLDNKFFANSGFAPWHQRAREGWLHRVTLRKQILGDDARVQRPGDSSTRVAATMDALLVDAKSKALSHPWHILEVRDEVDNPNVVHVFAVVEKSMHRFRVMVPRSIVVDAEKPDSCSQFSASRVRQLAGKILPRHKAPTHLFELTVGDDGTGQVPPSDSNGDETVETLRYLRDDVIEVYESDISPRERFMFASTCVATVRTALHVQHLKERGGAHRDLFHVSEFDASSTQNYLSNTVSSNGGVSLGNSVFVYHIGVETRGVLAVLHHDARKGLVVIVQPAAAARPTFTWNTLIEEALQVVGLPSGSHQVVPELRFEADMTDAWKAVSQFLVELSSGPVTSRPILAVVQSTLSSSEIMATGHLAHLHNLPVVRTLGAEEDEKLLVDAFRWSRFLVRRMLQRFYASHLWVDERLQVSRVSGVPLGNLSADVAVSALDFLFRRQLRRRGHVLWDSRCTDMRQEMPELRPRHVFVESGHYTWCVEMSLSQLDVIAVLFSQTIQEGDDPSARALADRGVHSHFVVLRDLLSELMGQAIASKKAAATLLLVSFSRWLHDTSAASYEPRLVELTSNFVHRALTALLIRVAKLGGKVVKATGQKLIVSSSKLSLRDAVHFAQFLCMSLKDQPLLSHLHLQPTRYWAPLIVADHHDTIGYYMEADSVAPFLDGREPQASDLKMDYEFSLWSPFNEETRQQLLQRLKSFCDLVVQTKHSVMGTTLSKDSNGNEATTLAKRGERVQENLSLALHKLVDNEIQPQLLEEVSGMLERRVQLLDNSGRKTSSTADASTAALEYTKLLCYLLELMPGVNAAMRKAKNNCLRVCGVGPFAPNAVFRKNADGASSRTQVLETRCGLCNEETSLHLRDCAGKEARCTSCNGVFSKDLIEAELLRKLTQLMHAYVQQDYVCNKCRQATASVMRQSCCGTLIGKHEAQVHREISAMLAIAEVSSLPILRGAASFALSCVNASS